MVRAARLNLAPERVGQGEHKAVRGEQHFDRQRLVGGEQGEVTLQAMGLDVRIAGVEASAGFAQAALDGGSLDTLQQDVAGGGEDHGFRIEV